MEKTGKRPEVLFAKTVVLTKEEQYRLARLWQNEGDVNARNTLVASIDLFIFGIAKKYAKRSTRLLADFFQEGREGAMRAVDKFDPEQGYKFTTYAAWWIRAYIQNYVHKQKRIAPFDEPSADENIYEDGFETRLGLAIDESGHPEEVLGMNGFGDRELVRQAMNLVLTRQERFVIWMRFFSPREPTLADVGKILGVSRERIRQIEARACLRLRRALSNWPAKLRMVASDHGITPNEAAKTAAAGQFRPPLVALQGGKK